MSKVVLITGASSGFGEICARRLAGKNFRVYGTSRRASFPSVSESPDVPVMVPTMVPMDVARDESVEEAIDFILEREGHIDVVVNNAGIGIAGSVEETSPDEARALFETNFFGTHRVCRAVLPSMRKRGSGLIVNVSSLGGRVTIPFQGFYSATKYAVEAFTEALRMEVAAFGIRVTMIEPGDFATGFTDARIFAEESRKSNVYAERCRAAVAVMENDERNGADPVLVADLLEKIIESDVLRVRYPVGSLGQRFGIVLMRFLPARLVEKALKTLYKV